MRKSQQPPSLVASPSEFTNLQIQLILQREAHLKRIVMAHASDIFIQFLVKYPHNQKYFKKDDMPEKRSSEQMRKDSNVIVHGTKIMTAICAFMDNLHNLDYMRKSFRETAIKHVKMKIPASSFHELMDSMLVSINDLVKFSKEEHAVWKKFFDVIFHLIIEQMEEVKMKVLDKSSSLLVQEAGQNNAAKKHP